MMRDDETMGRGDLAGAPGRYRASPACKRQLKVSIFDKIDKWHKSKIAPNQHKNNYARGTDADYVYATVPVRSINDDRRYHDMIR